MAAKDAVSTPSEPPAPRTSSPHPQNAVRSRFLQASLVAFACFFIWNISPFKSDTVSSDQDMSNQSNQGWHPNAASSGSSPFSKSAKKTFELPISSNLLFLVSEGATSAGTVHLQSSGKVKDTATVEVVIYYNTDQALEKADVHAIAKPGESGVGIYTPKDWHPSSQRDGLSFDVTVTFPASRTNSPLVINKFQTTMATFSQKIEELAGAVYFRNLNLSTSGSPISSGSVFAETAVIQTSGSSIKGSYSTSKSLHLTTTAGHIETSIDLHNADESQSTELQLKTSASKIDSDVRLYSTARNNGQGGAFDVSATTSAGHLDIRYPEAPVNHILHFKGQTASSTASVKLHPTYEGSFDASTSENRASVTYDDTIPDPSGQGRKRTVDTKQSSKHHVKGDVYWGNQTKQGTASLKTSENKATIALN